ncbi:MAG: hypothetical protein ABUS47_06615 [Steroidobacter sp.]
MHQQLWSLNALAVELNRDRRALARDLETLPPDEERAARPGMESMQGDAFQESTPVTGQRMLRLWRLHRVIGHLYGGSHSPQSALEEQRARLAREQADRVAMQNAVERGELLRVSTVAREWEKMIAPHRAQLLAMPTKMASVLARIRTPGEICKVLTDEVYRIMECWAAYKPGHLDSNEDHSGDSLEFAADNDA